MSLIYLDNSATTALTAPVMVAMCHAMGIYANPSSLHKAGTDAGSFIASCRRDILVPAGASKGFHLIFTGSGSEANNLAIKGFAQAGKHCAARRIFTTDSEHPSVTNSARAAASLYGFEYVKIPTKGGALDLSYLEEELKKGAALVSFMLVNNETGALYDIPAAAQLVRKYCPDALIHCDCVQGFTRVPLPLSCCDMLSVSAHKIHGPKGCGALFVSDSVIRRKALVPVISGGGQEEALRAGTENTVCIAGFAAAVKEAFAHKEADGEKLRALYEYAYEKITATGCRINQPQNHVDHILSVTLPGIKSQTMLSFLSAKDICVSAGSACSSKDRHISPSLHAFGLTDAEADSTVRVSLCADNTKEEIDALAAALGEGIAKLVRAYR